MSEAFLKEQCHPPLNGSGHILLTPERIDFSLRQKGVQLRPGLLLP
jgi:hypothetical protein